MARLRLPAGWAKQYNQLPPRSRAEHFRKVFIRCLCENGGDFEATCEAMVASIEELNTNGEFCDNGSRPSANYMRRIVAMHMKANATFRELVSATVDQTNRMLLSSAKNVHLRRVTEGDKELVVQSGKPVLSPYGLAIKAKMEDEGCKPSQIAGELARMDQEGQGVFVYRTVYPEALIRTVLGNVDPATFKEKFDPGRLSDTEIAELLVRASAGMALPEKTQEALPQDKADAIDAEFVDA